MRACGRFPGAGAEEHDGDDYEDASAAGPDARSRRAVAAYLAPLQRGISCISDARGYARGPRRGPLTYRPGGLRGCPAVAARPQARPVRHSSATGPLAAGPHQQLGRLRARANLGGSRIGSVDPVVTPPGHACPLGASTIRPASRSGRALVPRLSAFIAPLHNARRVGAHHHYVTCRARPRRDCRRARKSCRWPHSG